MRVTIPMVLACLILVPITRLPDGLADEGLADDATAQPKTELLAERFSLARKVPDLLTQKDFSRAQEYLETILKIEATLFGPNSHKSLRTLREFVVAAELRDDLEAAISYQDQVLHVVAQLVGPESWLYRRESLIRDHLLARSRLPSLQD